MLVKNNGFFFIELLTSLTTLFMIFLFFIPILHDLTNQSSQIEIENRSYQLIYEEFNGFVLNNQLPQNYSLTENGYVFQIYWKDTGKSLPKVVCVQIEKNHFLPKKEICLQSE